MRFQCGALGYHLLQPGFHHNLGDRVLATRLVSSLPVRVKLLLYSVDQLLDPQRAVVDDMDRIIPDVRRKLQRFSLRTGLVACVATMALS